MRKNTLDKPGIPENMLAKWQRVVDLTAALVNVPASLVMKTDAPEHAVLVTSDSAGNPYHIGDSFELNSKLYCHDVLKNTDELVVKDANKDPHWNDMADLEHGMSFYIGYPLLWPNGDNFGTICVLDQHVNRKALLQRKFLQQIRGIIESDLGLLTQVAQRESELEEANAALRALLSNLEEPRIDFEAQVLRQIKGLIMPHLAKLRHNAANREPDRSYIELVEKNLNKITSRYTRRLATAFENLTPAEIEIAQLVMNGRTTKDIADTLSRETSTIDFHRHNIRRKLSVASRTNLRSYLLSLQ